MPARSKSQRRLMGWALAYKRGDTHRASSEVRRLADQMDEDDLEDFARTKERGLPNRRPKMKKSGDLGSALDTAISKKEATSALGRQSLHESSSGFDSSPGPHHTALLGYLSRSRHALRIHTDGKSHGVYHVVEHDPKTASVFYTPHFSNKTQMIASHQPTRNALEAMNTHDRTTTDNLPHFGRMIGEKGPLGKSMTPGEKEEFILKTLRVVHLLNRRAAARDGR